jgi:hypothetical protein
MQWQVHVPQLGGGLLGLHVKLLLQTQIFSFPPGQSLSALTVTAFFSRSGSILVPDAPAVALVDESVRVLVGEPACGEAEVFAPTAAPLLAGCGL